MRTQHQTIEKNIDLSSPESRKSMAKLVTRLFDLWGLSVTDQLNLLGLSETSRSMLARYRKGNAIPNSRDMLDRVGWLLSIHKSLRLPKVYWLKSVTYSTTIRDRDEQQRTETPTTCRTYSSSMPITRAPSRRGNSIAPWWREPRNACSPRVTKSATPTC